MNRSTTMQTALPALLFATLLGCGSGGSTGSMSVHLVDAPTLDYEQVNIDVQRVEIHDDATGEWIRLDDPARSHAPINLLDLRFGVSATLAHGVTVPAGHYSQMRLILGPNNTCKPTGGTIQPLKVPSGMQSGVKLNVSFDVAPGTTKDVFIDFQAHRSVFVHSAGHSGQYLLRPVVRAYDKLATGSITGTLTDATHIDSLGKPSALPGVVVTAQTIDPISGVPSVVRSVTSNVDGTYALDLLPVDGSYYVVVEQPVTDPTLLVPPKVWAAYASASAIPVTSQAPVVTYDASLDVAPAGTGSITGAITPVAVAPIVDEVWIEAPVASAGPTFVVRTTVAQVAVDGNSESYGVAGLPFGGYSVVLARRFLSDLGDDVIATTIGKPAVLSTSVPFTVDLVAPSAP